MNQVLMKLSELPCQFLCLYRLIGSNEINIHFNELLDDNIIIRSPSIYLQSQFMSFFNPLRMLEKYLITIINALITKFLHFSWCIIAINIINNSIRIQLTNLCTSCRTERDILHLFGQAHTIHHLHRFASKTIFVAL